MAFRRTGPLHHWVRDGLGRPIPVDKHGRPIAINEAVDMHVDRRPTEAAGGEIGHDFLATERYQAETETTVYGPMPTGDPGGPPNAVPSVQVHPVWEFPTVSSFQYDINVTSNNSVLGPGTQLAAAVGAQLLLPELVYAPLASSPVGAQSVQPDNFFSVLRLVSIFLNNPNGTDNVIYVVRLNGAPVAGFTYRFFSRIAANESQNNGVLLRDIPQNTKIDMLIQNLAATGPWTVGGRLSGWSYPLADQIALYGNIRV